MSANTVKSREVVMRVVIPKLREKFPTGHVNRPTLMSACTEAGIPWQPWLLSNVLQRGLYDISPFYGESETAVKSSGVKPVTYRYEVDAAVIDNRTEEEVETAVADRFAVLDRMARGVAQDKFRAVIISGPPGVGKTWTAERILETTPGLVYEKVTGFSRATGLYKMLHENKDGNNALLLDDCDSIFSDDVALSLLKAACDSTANRMIHWRAESKMEDELGESLPKKFPFQGRIVFVTNLDFDALIRASNRLAPHLEAMVSRAFYLDLNLTPREVLSRVLSVTKTSDLLKGWNAQERARITGYVKANAASMRELSLRSIVKLAQILAQAKSEEDFKRIADATLLRR